MKEADLVLILGKMTGLLEKLDAKLDDVMMKVEE